MTLVPSFNFLAEKKAARQALHKTLAVSCKHKSALTGVISDVAARVHTKVHLSGDIDYQGYAELSDGMVLIHFTIEDANRLRIRANDTLIYDKRLVYKLDTQRYDDNIYLHSWYARFERELSADEQQKLMGAQIGGVVWEEIDW